MNKKLLLFDMDNTIAHSGQKITKHIKDTRYYNSII